MHSCCFQKSQRRYYSLSKIFIYLGGAWGGGGGNQEAKQHHKAAETQWHISEEHKAMLSCSAKALSGPARSHELPLTRGNTNVPPGQAGAKRQRNPGKTAKVKHNWALLVWNRGDSTLESNTLGNLRKYLFRWKISS